MNNTFLGAVYDSICEEIHATLWFIELELALLLNPIVMLYAGLFFVPVTIVVSLLQGRIGVWSGLFLLFLSSGLWVWVRLYRAQLDDVFMHDVSLCRLFCNKTS